MRKIDIAKVIELRLLDRDEVARQLFPDNGHPKPALSRVIRGDGSLDARQVAKLAVMARLNETQLFDSENLTAKEYGPGYLQFSGPGYSAEVDMEHWMIRLWSNRTLYCDILLIEPSLSFAEVVNFLNTKIEHSENG